MSKNYELIAKVDIDLTSPVVDETSFDHLLIVGALPAKAPTTAPAPVGEYASLEEVVAAGWVAEGTSADPVGVAAKVAFGQSPRPAKIYIAAIQADETALAAVQRAVETDGWYAVCPAGVAKDQYEGIAEYIETQEKIFIYTETDCFAVTESTGETTCAATIEGDHFRTMWIFGKETSDQEESKVPAYNEYMNVAFAAAWLQHHSGSETAAFKTLKMVSPAKLSAVEVAALTNSNGNYFTTVGNANVTMNGKVSAGEWADIIRFRDWQKNDMQVAVANLFLSVPKVPYTDKGIALIQNQMEASLKRGQNCGGICEDEFDEVGNTIKGYKISVPSASAISSAEKATRKLRDLKFSARLAGAIHFAELHGSLTYDLV